VKRGDKSRELLSAGSPLALRKISFLEGDDFSISLLANTTDFLTVDIGLKKIISSYEGRLSNDTFFVNVSFDQIPQLETYSVVDARASNTIRGIRKFWSPEFSSRLSAASLPLPKDAEKSRQEQLEINTGQEK
jgi:hypothetical protein